MRLYTTLWNINEMCIHNDNYNEYFGKIEIKHFRPTFAVNGLYDTRLCGYNTV